MSGCGEKFTGTIYLPLEYPSVGWEPIMESDVCTRPKGHDGDHSGRRLVLAELAGTAPSGTGGTQDGTAPILGDRNPNAVVGVPWNEKGYAGEGTGPQDGTA